MKKMILFFVLLMALPLAIFAQEPVVNPPTNWFELLAGINIWLGTLAGVSAVTVFLAGFFNTLLKTVGFAKQVVAWVVALLVITLGNIVNLGFMAELNWWQTIVYGLAAGLVSNGFFDIELVKMILRAIGIEKKV